MPDQRSRWSASHRAVPMKLVMWMSWPQACITPTSRPALSRVFCLAGVGQPGLLDDRQRVHVGANQHDRALAVLQDADDAELADVRRHLGAGLLQLVGDSLRRLDLLAARAPDAYARCV